MRISSLLALLIALNTVPGVAGELPGAAGKTIENILGMQLVRIPAGTFLMGSDESPEHFAADFPQYDRSRFLKLADESPVHEVRISRPFYLGKYEITVGQFRRFLAESSYVPESLADQTGGYGYNPDYDPSTTVRGDAFEGRSPRYSWSNPGFPQDDNHPVVNVTWNDAQAMARWLSQKEGKTYRLPTEAEWEYACRAGTRTRYSAGDKPEVLLEIANTFDAETAKNWPKWQAYALPGSDGFAFTAPVGRFKPNAWGLYDMHGNAWEWVADWHSDTYYSESPTDDPKGPARGEVKVRRGGSWHTWSFYARAAFRNWNTVETRYTLLGMRLLREISEGDWEPQPPEPASGSAK